MGGVNGNVVAITRCKTSLYQMTFTEICWVDAVKFVCSRVGGGMVKLWYRRLKHLNVKHICTPKHGEGHEPK